ncbi:MFS transporter [Actinoallomurus bryophytorum]|uniref:MFS transporter n=1 Tax=Actinoallomurus bryophytorum TaxID=1490222 RepID=A0A543BSW2_9ACTN|nr:MFS transporter [Actinoallomurus bryophytorum]TQL87902.1 MFS transporter [Actinoallomurus bryophytorum]
MRAVLRLPDFRLLFAGLAASMAGDALMVLVYAIWVKHLTGSSGAAGFVSLFIVVPYVVSPLGGRLVDRFRRRPFLVVVNLCSVLMMLPLFAVRTAGDVWIVYAVATLNGVSSVANAAALNGLLKELLADGLLATANGAIQTVREGLRLGGPLAGAALFAAAGGAAVALVDAVTFLAAALAIARMRLREETPVNVRQPWRRQLTAGLTHIRGDAALRRMMIAGAVAFLVVGFNESVFFSVLDHGLHRPPAFLGVLASAQGVGCVAGGLLAARLIGGRGENAATAIGLAAFGLGDALCVLPRLAAVLAGKAVAGVGLAVIVVGFTTALQRRTPAPLVAQVSMTAETLVSGPQTVSIATGALLVSVVDYRILLMAVAAGMLGGAAYLWTGRRLSAPSPAVRPEEAPA